MIEQWIQWKLKEPIEKNYLIESISNLHNGLCILMSASNDKKKKLSIIFENHVASYRWTDETYYYQTEDMLVKKYGKEFYHKTSFFKIENSLYLQSLSEGSYKIAEERSLTHFVIIGIDSMMDIIAPGEPKVEIFTEP